MFEEDEMRAARLFGSAVLGLAMLASWGTTTAGAHGSLAGALLKVGEVPAMFTSTAAKTYTAYVPFLKVTVQGPYGKYGDVCSTPSIVAGKYQLGMIQSFGHTDKRLANVRVCSFLYASSAAGHKAYLSLVTVEKTNAGLYGTKGTTSKVGDESAAYVGKTSDELVFRTSNAVFNVWYTDFKGVQMSTSAFLGLGPKLLARLHG
jgi:hypothetical protein